MSEADYLAQALAERKRRFLEQLEETSREAERLLTVRGPRPQPRLIRRASEAEGLCAEWLRWMGFPNAKVTDAGADGGIDVRGDGARGRMVAQVKFEAVPTGRPKLQKLFGAGTAEHAAVFAFFASAGYTQRALLWANKVGMALFGFELDGSLKADNISARQLLEN